MAARFKGRAGRGGYEELKKIYVSLQRTRVCKPAVFIEFVLTRQQPCHVKMIIHLSSRGVAAPPPPLKYINTSTPTPQIKLSLIVRCFRNQPPKLKPVAKLTATMRNTDKALRRIIRS